MTVLAKARSNITKLPTEAMLVAVSDELAERQSPAGKDMSMKAEKSELLASDT
jgi:hypothetical protein